jgi:UDP-N-acetylmuramoylalanine--D-glutamate ligase
MNFPPITFTDNWLTLITVIRLLDLPLDRLTHYAAACAIPAHRLEKVATIRGITFYNDSKSTIGAATLAAVRSLPQKPILLLGGLSKGVDRQNLICVLAHTVKAIICFGAEREQLFAWCCDYTIPACAHASLRDAFFAGVAIAQPGDTLLLSPAGSSFDLFDDYKARGTAFNQLVQEFHTTVQSTYAPSGISSAISDPGDSMAGIDGN